MIHSIPMKFELQNYLTSTGENPVESWFMSLDAQTAQRIHRSLDQLKQGNFTGCKPIVDAKVKGVRERRIDFGPGYRVYFGRDGEKLIILLTGGNKKSQRRDVSKALDYWKDYKARKGGN